MKDILDHGKPKNKRYDNGNSTVYGEPSSDDDEEESDELPPMARNGGPQMED